MRTKKNLVFGLIIFLPTLISQSILAQQKPEIKPAVYQLDTRKSKLYWQAPKNKHSGYILFNSGILNEIINGWPTKGTFSIDMNSVHSASETTDAETKKIDGKLKSDDFFGVAKYPTATMVVNKIVQEPNGVSFKANGVLNIKGISKPLEFIATMKKTGNKLIANANTAISRANWNVNKASETAVWDILGRLKENMIANDIPIKLELVFVKKG